MQKNRKVTLCLLAQWSTRWTSFPLRDCARIDPFLITQIRSDPFFKLGIKRQSMKCKEPTWEVKMPLKIKYRFSCLRSTGKQVQNWKLGEVASVDFGTLEDKGSVFSEKGQKVLTICFASSVEKRKIKEKSHHRLDTFKNITLQSFLL